MRIQMRKMRKQTYFSIFKTLLYWSFANIFLQNGVDAKKLKLVFKKLKLFFRSTFGHLGFDHFVLDTSQAKLLADTNFIHLVTWDHLVSENLGRIRHFFFLQCMRNNLWNKKFIISNHLFQLSKWMPAEILFQF